MLRFVYRSLLRLHPRYFRQRFAEEMLWIFDQAEGELAAAKLLADGSISLVRQWILRREFWEEPTARAASDGVPMFYSFDTFKPRSGALIQGIVLSAVVFWVACLTMKYGWNHTVRIPFGGVEYGNDSHDLTSDGHTTSAGYAGAATTSGARRLPSATETGRQDGVSSNLRTLFSHRLGIPQFRSESPSAGIGSAGQPNGDRQSQRAILAKSSATCGSAAPLSGLAQTTHCPTQLPHPSGKYGVARIGFDWVDRTRPERYAKDFSARREIMVYVWYPTERGLRRATLSQYLPHADAIAKSEKGMSGSEIEELWGSSWRRILLNQVAMDTHEQTPIASGSERFPLLMFSPGYGVPSTIYTTLIQEVVSHGYVVASIEPTYDVAAVAFPDGRVVPFRQDEAQPGQPAPPGETWNEFLNRSRMFEASHTDPQVADIRFVIDQFTTLDNTKKEAVPFAGRVDLHSIGAWGHSIGGSAAGKACQLDTRIKACLSADGGGVPEGACLPGQPFMGIGIYHEPATDEQLAVHKITRKEWEKDRQARLAASEQRLRACSGVRYQVGIKIPGANHYSFTDWPLLDAENAQDTDTALHALEPIQGYTIAFFDKHLKHQPATLLDKTSPASAGITLEKHAKAR